MVQSPAAGAIAVAREKSEPPPTNGPTPRYQAAEVRERLSARIREIRAHYMRERERLIDATLCVDAKGAGALFDLSERQWRHLSATDEVPAPRKLGGAVRWHLAELAAWSEAGCPNRETWEAMR